MPSARPTSAALLAAPKAKFVAPGDTLKVGDSRVTVEAASQSSDGQTADLDVTIADDSVSNVDPLPPPSSRRAASASVGAGFTHEEELFRAKWGWATFDEVRRAARERQRSP